jgi:hypothetical protein
MSQYTYNSYFKYEDKCIIIYLQCFSIHIKYNNKKTINTYSQCYSKRRLFLQMIGFYGELLACSTNGGEERCIQGFGGET